MANEKWRMDLKKDIREALETYFGPGDVGLSGVTYAVLANVLPHLEGAYKRGEMAGRSRAGYKIPNPRKESE
jgi:hypothetical protein